MKQSTTDAQDECNCNHQMFPTPTETRCCSLDGKEEVGSARSRSCSHSKLLYLQKNSTHISIAMICMELAQQQFCREPLTHEVGDSVAIITIEDTVEVAVVLTPAKRAEAKRSQMSVRHRYKQQVPGDTSCMLRPHPLLPSPVGQTRYLFYLVLCQQESVSRVQPTYLNFNQLSSKG